MKQQVHAIIRNQWPQRHSKDLHTRAQARNLILAHVALARRLATSADEQSASRTRANLIAPLYTPVLQAA